MDRSPSVPMLSTARICSTVPVGAAAAFINDSRSVTAARMISGSQTTADFSADVRADVRADVPVGLMGAAP